MPDPTKNLLLLHGAIGSKAQFESIGDALKNKFIIHSINFTGHGGNSLPDEPFSIELFAKDVLNYLESHELNSINIFGYSMGGYVGMYLARHHPDKINKLVTLATKFEWSEEIAAREIKMLDAEKISEKIPRFAGQLAERHAPADWKKVLTQTIEMMILLGKNNFLKIEDYKNIVQPCLLLLGDRDKMIPLEETTGVYKHLPNAQLGILPGTPHPIEQVNINLLSAMLSEFI